MDDSARTKAYTYSRETKKEISKVYYSYADGIFFSLRRGRRRCILVCSACAMRALSAIRTQRWSRCSRSPSRSSSKSLSWGEREDEIIIFLSHCPTHLVRPILNVRFKANKPAVQVGRRGNPGAVVIIHFPGSGWRWHMTGGGIAKKCHSYRRMVQQLLRLLVAAIHHVGRGWRRSWWWRRRRRLLG